MNAALIQSTTSPAGDRRRFAGTSLRLLLRTAKIVSLFMLALSRPDPLSAQTVHRTESQVEAAYLFNFGKFVQWPAERLALSPTFDICVFGKDPFGPVLDGTVAGESIGGKAIAVRRITRLPEIAPCSILFVSSSEQSQVGAIIRASQPLGIVTVSDLPHFAERGGIIDFVMQDGRIRFEVNRAACQRSQLVLSSELLKVASRVIDSNPPGREP